MTTDTITTPTATEKLYPLAGKLEAALRRRLTDPDSLASLEVRYAFDRPMLEVFIRGRLLEVSPTVLEPARIDPKRWPEVADQVIARVRRKPSAPPRTWDLYGVELEVSRTLERISGRLPAEDQAALASRATEEFAKLKQPWARSRLALKLIEEAIVGYLDRMDGQRRKKG